MRVSHRSVCASLAVAVVTLLNACATTPAAPDMSGLEQISPMAVRDALVAAQPTATAVRLLDSSGDGFVIGLDGSAEFRAFRARSDLRDRTRVTKLDDSEVCLARGSWWVGGCIRLFGRDGEVMAAVVQYPTGPSVRWNTTPEAVF